jgi:hypothetical protein
MPKAEEHSLPGAWRVTIRLMYCRMLFDNLGNRMQCATIIFLSVRTHRRIFQKFSTLSSDNRKLTEIKHPAILIVWQFQM